MEGENAETDRRRRAGERPEYIGSQPELLIRAERVEAIRDGISLLLVDLFPPGSLDLQGIHKAVWDEFIDNDFALPQGKPLTLASYIGGPIPEAFIEPVAVGDPLTDMPLFLSACLVAGPRT